MNSSQSKFEELLDLKAGDLVLLLDPVLSLIAIDERSVQIYHKSLFDYLLDPSRSGHLPLDLARVHEVAATYMLKNEISTHGHEFFFALHLHSYLTLRS